MFPTSPKSDVIEVIVLPNGHIQATVKGVDGKECTSISAILDQLGQVTLDTNTSDYYKQDQQRVIRTTGL